MRNARFVGLTCDFWRKPFTKSLSWRHDFSSHPVSYNTAPQECPTKGSYKSVPQECPARMCTRVSYKSVPLRVSPKNVLQERPTRVPNKSVRQECPTKVSPTRVSKIVWAVVFEYVLAFGFAGSILFYSGNTFWFDCFGSAQSPFASF